MEEQKASEEKNFEREPLAGSGGTVVVGGEGEDDMMFNDLEGRLSAGEGETHTQ